jgi:hypothetical protein
MSDLMTIERLKTMSTQDFETLGVNVVAFVKPVRVDSQKGFAICAADGRQMAVVGDHDQAVAAILQNDLEPVSVH